MTDEEIRLAVIEYYRSINIQLNPCLPHAEYLNLYKKMKQLASDERLHKENRSKLRLVK